MDNAARMAQRWIRAWNLECTQELSDRISIAPDPRQSDFHCCAHCALELKEVQWKRWKIWIGAIRFDWFTTYAPWTNQIPPSDEDERHHPGRKAAYDRCVVVGTDADDHGQYLPGKQLNPDEYWIRMVEGDPRDEEVLHFVRHGASWGFTENSQPPCKGWDRHAARKAWLATPEITRQQITADFNEWAGIGEFEGRSLKKWVGELNHPPPTVTPQYLLLKDELELVRDEVDKSVMREQWNVKKRIVTNTAKGKMAGEQNDASTCESTTRYGNAETFAQDAIAGGTVGREDEPKAFCVQGTEWKEHSVITVVVPGSLDNPDEECYMQAAYWVFGGHHYPRLQMLKSEATNRMRQRGFGRTQYADKTVRATPQDPPGDWKNIIMDDYGASWSSMFIGEMQAEEFDALQTILGPGTKRKKRVNVGFHVVGNTVTAAFGGVGFCLYHPLMQPGYMYVPQAKVVKYILIVKAMLLQLHTSGKGRRGLGTCTKKAWARVAGVLNYALAYTSLQHFFIEIARDLWPNVPIQQWTERGDPCRGKDRKGKRLLVDWQPSLKHQLAFRGSDVITPSITSIEHLERVVQMLAIRNGILIYTGLPLQGRWRGQVAQSNEELLALPRGDYWTSEGIPWFCTDATKKLGCIVTGKEVALTRFPGDMKICCTEMRSVHMGVVTHEHMLLPPPEMRVQIGTPTWHPSDFDATPNPVPQVTLPDGSGTMPGALTFPNERRDKMFLAACRALGLCDNQNVTYAWAKSWSLSDDLNIDLRACKEWCYEKKLALALRYINTHINRADGPTRGKGHPWTQCIWFNDAAWHRLTTTCGLFIDAEAYADAQNARAAFYCTAHTPFEQAVKHGRKWFINCEWADFLSGLRSLLDAQEQGQEFEFAFILPDCPSLKHAPKGPASKSIRNKAIAFLIRLGARKLDFEFKIGDAVFMQRKTFYKDTGAGSEPFYELGEAQCSPLPWRVDIWATPGMMAAP